MNETRDRIESQIDIDATAETVWNLISRPGWWINEGVIIENQPQRRGDVDIVTHEKFGEFPIRTVSLEAPRYAAFRWEPGGDSNGHMTLTEFRIEDRPEGGVVLTVCESGFSSLDVTEEKRRALFAENSQGWANELEAARTYVMGR